MPDPSRYQEKPLLRLLECFVLKAIDKLPKSEESKLEELAPKLAQVYGCQGHWDDIIANIMEFPENMTMLIRQTWEQNQEIAEEQGVELSPQQFSEMFADQNFTS